VPLLLLGAEGEKEEEEEELKRNLSGDEDEDDGEGAGLLLLVAVVVLLVAVVSVLLSAVVGRACFRCGALDGSISLKRAEGLWVVVVVVEGENVGWCVCPGFVWVCGRHMAHHSLNLVMTSGKTVAVQRRICLSSHTPRRC